MIKLKLISALLIFLSSYFPLAIIFIIKDLSEVTYMPQHLRLSIIIFITMSLCILLTIFAVLKISGGSQIKITKVANKSGDMFTYTIPYMISFYNFNLGDWRTLLSLGVFMTLMFILAYRTQNIFVNPVLALLGYGLYDCQFRDGKIERQGLLISKVVPQVNDNCVVERLSHLSYFVTSTQSKRDTDD